MLAGLIGNVLEWFDFAVYGYFANDIGLDDTLRVTAAGAGNPFSEALPALLSGERRPRVSRDAYAARAPDIFQYAPWARA